MKIDRVTLENFGIYTRKVFQLDAAPLVLIYGPNESGKTTALNGLRQALFGFKTRTPYLTGRTMTAEVIGRMSNGDQLQFSRRKARLDEIIGSLAGRPLQPEELQRCLCYLDITSYEHLFGFSLDELREGEAALKSARLSEALAGGGLGGMHALQQLRGELQQSLTDLYKPRGSTSSINLKLAELQKSHEALRATQVLPTAVEQLQGDLTEVREQSERARQRYAEVIQARLAAERLRDALPKYHQRAALERHLASMELPTEIDMKFAVQWADFADQLQATTAKLEAERTQLEHQQSELSQLGGSHEISNFELEIEQVGHQATEISTARHRIHEFHEQMEDAQLVCRRLLEELELPEFDERLRTFSIGSSKRRELDLLSRDYAAVVDEIIATNARLDAAQDLLSQSDQPLVHEQEVPGNLAELTRAVTHLQELERDFAFKSEALQKSLNDRELRALRISLLESVGNQGDLDSTWNLPTVKQIQQARNTTEELQREFSSAKRQLAKLEKDRSIALERLQSLDRSHADGMLANVATTQAARDAIIHQWLDDLSQPLIAASITTKDQQDRLLELQRLAATSDRLQTEIFAAADSLALFNQQRLQLETLDTDVAGARLALTELNERVVQAANDWNELWAAVPFQPESHELMLSWRQDFTRWLEAETLQDHHRREAHIARGLIRNQRLQLQDLWPVNLRDNVTCETLVQQLRRWESLVHDVQRDRERVRTATENRNQLTEKLASLQLQRQRFETTYAEWLAQVPVAIEWPLEQVGKLIDCLEQLRREEEAQRRTERQMAALQNQVDQYDAQVQILAQQLGQEIATGSLESHAARWLQELKTMRSQRTQRIRIATAIEHRQKDICELETRHQTLNEKLAALCGTTGNRDAVEVGALVERVRKAEELRAQIAELSASIEPHSGNEPLGLFTQRLKEADEARLHLEIEEYHRESQQLDETRKEADQAIGSLTQRIEQLANNQAAQRHQQALQNQRDELAELAEQWVVQRLAQELLNRSIDRFSAAHEPALLIYTREYLRKLTGGRYTTVEHDNAKPGSFLVRNARDEPYTPEQLSTGTREQLYLAIRMAFITHHNEQHEPLPVIMDDCFVNFDDARTRHALEAIASWDQSLQTILLSCHWRVVQSLAEFAPETVVIHLEKDLQTTAGELCLAAQTGR